MKPRVFVDTGVAIRILFFENFENGLLEEMREKFQLVVSETVREEVRKFAINNNRVTAFEDFDFTFNRIFKEITPSA